MPSWCQPRSWSISVSTLDLAKGTGNLLRVNGQEVAVHLARTLDAVVPDGFKVEAREGHIRMFIPARGSWAVNGVAEIVEQAGDLEENIITACYSILDAVQDFVSEELTEPWPRRDMPMPGAQIRGRRVELWYGDAETPILTLEPLDLNTP